MTEASKQEREVFMGEVDTEADGVCYLWADLRLEHHVREEQRETVDHEYLTEYDSIGISFKLVHKRPSIDPLDVDWDRPFVDRNWVQGGQTAPEDRVIARAGVRTISAEDVAFIEQTWLDWHLNDLTAGCSHMPSYEEIAEQVPAAWPQQYGRPDVSGYAIAKIVCPETGYRWGRKWLVRVLPADVVERMQQIVSAK